jgi:serine/threonine protein kinase
LPACDIALRELHTLGLIHGDVNRHNFIIDETGRARIIDFEHSSLLTPEKEANELEELRAMFSLDPRLGGAVIVVDGIEREAGPTPCRI